MGQSLDRVVAKWFSYLSKFGFSQSIYIPSLVLIWNCVGTKSEIEKQSELKVEKNSSLLCRCLYLLGCLCLP